MPGLGPRVGGAHVDVNLQFDDRSIADVGRKIHRQLTEIGQRNGKIYREIGKDAVRAWRSALGAIVAAAPLMGSAISALAGSATALAGAFYSVGQSANALLPVMVALGIAAGTAKIGFEGFGDAVNAADPEELAAALKNLSPSARAAALAVRSLKDEAHDLRLFVQQKMFAGLSGEIRELSGTLFPVLQRGLGKMADALNELFRSLLKYVNSEAGLKQIGAVLDNSADIFKRLSKAAIPFLDGFLRLINALAPAGKRLADRITDIAIRFQEWTKAEGFGKRIDDMMKRAEKTAGLLFKVLGNLGAAIANVFNAANPSTNTFLQMLVDVTQRFEDWTASIGGQDAIAQWASQSIDVMRQFGETVEAVFKVLAELSDPRVIVSFLATLESAFNFLGKLPLDKMVSAFATLAETLQPISGPLLAFVIAGAGFNILVGGMIGQVAGLAGGLARLTGLFGRGKKGAKGFADGIGGTSLALKGELARDAQKTAALGAMGTGFDKSSKKAGLFSRVIDRTKSMLGLSTVAVGTHRAQVGKLSTTFKGLGGVLSKGLKFAGLAGLAVWIVSIVSKSDKLKAKLKEVFSALGEVFSALGEAFSSVSVALDPVFKALKPVFDLLDKLAGLAIGVALDAITLGFESLAKVIEGVSDIVAGFIGVLIGLVTMDFSKMKDGLKQIASGFGPLLKGLFSLFDPARLVKIGLGAIKGLGDGITKAIPGVLNAVNGFALRILTFFATLPFKLATLGGRAIGALAQAVGRAAPLVLTAAGRIVTGVLGWIGRLPGRLLSLGLAAVSQLAGAVSRGIPRLLGIAGQIVSGVVGFIARLPGQLLSLGQQAIARLAGAVGAGVGRLRAIAGNIVSAIVGAIAGLPGKMLDIGRNIVGSLADGISSGIGKIKDAMSAVAGVAGKFWPGSPVEEGPLRKWNYGGDASGGGRNVIEALTAGLRDTSPIKKAMSDVAATVASSLTPTVGAGALGGSVTNSRSLSLVINNPQAETGSDSLTRTARNLAYLGLS